jgi:plasmid maintenance system killer protein
MPGENLYSVKLATEQIRLIFAFSDDSKIGYLTQFAETRIAEIVYATERGDVDMVEAALERLERNLAEVEEIVTPDMALSVIAALEEESLDLETKENTIRRSYERAQDKLKEIKEPDPEKKREITNRVYEAYSKAIKAIEAAKAD